MKNQKYCCERFQGYYEKPEPSRLTFPFIKIYKIEKDEWNKGKKLLRYSIVCGFEKDKPPHIIIKYCPFCGKNLFKFYKSDKWVNGEFEI